MDALTNLCAALACLLLLVGLQDTPRTALELVPAPPVPSSAGKRDRALSVIVPSGGVNLSFG